MRADRTNNKVAHLRKEDEMRKTHDNGVTTHTHNVTRACGNPLASVIQPTIQCMTDAATLYRCWCNPVA